MGCTRFMNVHVVRRPVCVRLVAADVQVRPGGQRGELVSTWSTNVYVISLLTHSELKPTSVPV